MPHAPAPGAPSRYAKVSEQGFVMMAELEPDHTVREWRAGRTADSWSGEWSVDDDRLTIRIGEYRLVVAPGSSRAVETSDSWAPSAFHVFAVSTMGPKAARVAAIKVFGDGRIYAAELLAGGELREYDLRAGWQAEAWSGAWRREGDELVLSVNGYEWRGTSSDGEWSGEERAPNGSRSPITVVTVELTPADTRDPMGPTVGAPLFEYAGYEFFEIGGAPRGYFGRVMEARRAGGYRFAAKLIRPSERVTAHREAEIASRISGVDGLIPAFESFDLPDDRPRFGELAGHSVQVLEWGMGDLGGSITRGGPMSPDETLRVIADVAGALDSLHRRFRLVHSDVKPANIIAREAGTGVAWRLADFNVATAIDADGDAPFLGTTEVCRSPEMRARHEAGDRTIRPADDLWALGLVGLQCLTGATFAQGRVIERDRARRLADPFPGRVVDIIRACLAADAEGITAASIRTRALAAL